MSEFTIQGASERFEHKDADLLEEIRIMAEADEQAGCIPLSPPRRSLLIRLLTRRATARLAA